ncbi:MAG: hypothetical protein ACM308_01395 [Qipengyuania vulgaris]
MDGSVQLGSRPREASKRRSRPARRAASQSYFLASLVIAIIAAGWLTRGRIGINPAEGVGYWLGIIGASMMVVLLGYPLRKRGGAIIPGSVGTWFRIHMSLGILGPLLILFHAGFSWRALNSGVALWAMILVVLSGLIGRYLHIHLYSRNSLRHREAEKIFAELRKHRDRLDRDGELGQAVEQKLAGFQQIVTHPRKRLTRTIASALNLGIAIKLQRHSLMNAAADEVMSHMMFLGAGEAEAKQAAVEVRKHLRAYLDALLDAGTFGAFERLFALWHVAHIPLYLFLAVTAIIHILAAHYF